MRRWLVSFGVSVLAVSSAVAVNLATSWITNLWAWVAVGLLTVIGTVTTVRTKHSENRSLPDVPAAWVSNIVRGDAAGQVVQAGTAGSITMNSGPGAGAHSPTINYYVEGNAEELKPERADFADALLRGPSAATGADQHLSNANRMEPEDPRRAAHEVQLAEELLANGGFAAHAAVLTRRRAGLLSAAGGNDEAVELLSRDFWRALDNYDNSEAEILVRDLDQAVATEDGKVVSSIAQTAIQVVRAPLGMPSIDLDEVHESRFCVENARLALLLAETAAIDPESTWTSHNVDLLSRCADELTEDDAECRWLACRLRIEIADVTGEWADLLDSARTRRAVPRRTAAVILARYAMHRAEHGDFAEADQAWEDAVEQGCLAGWNSGAAEWVHSRRILHSRHLGLTAEPDDFPNLVKSLWQAGDATSQVSLHRMQERAIEAVAAGKLHLAAPLLRTWLRSAHASGFWGDANHVRILLADVYEQSGEADAAVDLLVLAGEAKKAEETAKEAGDHYLDTRKHLAKPAYWMPATGFRVSAIQADLVPDDQVGEIVENAIDVLRRGRAGKLRDTAFFSPSLATEALKALAALSARLTPEQAEWLLDYLSPLVPRRENSYRFTDNDHVDACVGIASAHTSLQDKAVTQLLGLLAEPTSGVAQRVQNRAADLFELHADLVRERLAELMEGGNRAAGALLALITDEPSDAQLAAARTAAEQLAAPSKNTAQSMGFGTPAISQSLLALHLPAAERTKLVLAQLDRAAAPYEFASDRADYYLAAANLADGLEDVADLFAEAIRRSDDQAPSPGDLLSVFSSHPLGTFRTTGLSTDTRGHALFLAARLARTPDEQEQVRKRAVGLLAAGGDTSHYAARALLNSKPEDLQHDVALLSVHQDWAARSVAALAWASNSPSDPSIGVHLAGDRDPRVRRTLAEAVQNAEPTEALDQVRRMLESDPRYSVRRKLATGHSE